MFRPFLAILSLGIRLRTLALLAGVVGLGTLGCGDDAGGDDEPVLDAGPNGDDDDVDAGPSQPDFCDENGLTRRPFDEGPGGPGYTDLAGDFTVETLDGTLTLSEAWSGCETFTFVNYIPTDQPGGPGDQLWDSNPSRLFERAAPNARFVFASYESDPEAVRERVTYMKTLMEIVLEEELGESDFAYWKDRLHYMTTPLVSADGSLGSFLADRSGPLVSFGIDRLQRWDWGGLLNPFVGATQNLAMAGWASRYYNYHSDLNDRLEAEAASGVTVVNLIDEDAWTERQFTRTATLPPAAEMARFDELVVDVHITCREEVQDCSEWDRNAYVRLCTEGGTCQEGEPNVELVRWITPYWRPGERRWLMEATPQLGWLQDGGERTFRVILGPPWERATPRDIEVNLRLRETGAADRPVGAELAFRGGPFDAEYNESRPPYAFTPPEGTSRVEVVAIVSGHGDAPGTRCGEWCAHGHGFQVNDGTEHRLDWAAEDIGSPVACAEQTDEGVPPGQGGNWAMSRAYWCPGLPVELNRFDVTEDVDLAGENELAYEGSFASGLPAGGNIDLSVFLIYYR